MITLFLTCSTKEEAEETAELLLDQKLAACVRLTDVESIFLWKGKKEHSKEVILIIESIQEKFDDIEKAVNEVHNYETFVLTAYPIVKASAGVEEWVKESIR